MNKQILEVVSAVSMEKGVDKEIIFEALEEAISSATKKLIGEMSLVNVKINRDTGDYETFREWDIVDEDELEDEPVEEAIDEAAAEEAISGDEDVNAADQTPQAEQ